MDEKSRALLQIARIAIDAFALESEAPPPATPIEPWEPLLKVPRKRAPIAPPEPTQAEPLKKRTGRPKGALDYICLACKHGFRAVKPIHCPNPECGAHSNFILKKDYNKETLPDA